MIEFLLLIVFSIVIARYLEARYKVASILHTILFVFMATFYIFGSNAPVFVFIGSRLIPMEHYEFIHGALTDWVDVANISLSSLLFIEAIVYVIVFLVSIVFMVKRLKKIIASIRIKFVNKETILHLSNRIYSCNERPLLNQNICLKYGVMLN